MNSSTKERTGILGGTFDPVHCGHLGLAEEIREKAGLGSVIFVPAHVSPHKQAQSLTSTNHRQAMLRLALQTDPAYSISDIELQRQGVSYTIDTVRQLQEANPNVEWYLILGNDTFCDLHTWHETETLLELSHVLVGTRPGHPMEVAIKAIENLGPNAYQREGFTASVCSGITYRHRKTGMSICFLETTLRDISSSAIRKQIGCGEEIKNMLPPEVQHYIIAKHLYQIKPQTITE